MAWKAVEKSVHEGGFFVICEKFVIMYRLGMV